MASDTIDLHTKLSSVITTLEIMQTGLIEHFQEEKDQNELLRGLVRRIEIIEDSRPANHMAQHDWIERSMEERRKWSGWKDTAIGGIIMAGTIGILHIFFPKIF